MRQPSACSSTPRVSCFTRSANFTFSASALLVEKRQRWCSVMTGHIRAPDVGQVRSTCADLLGQPRLSPPSGACRGTLEVLELLVDLLEQRLAMVAGLGLGLALLLRGLVGGPLGVSGHDPEIDVLHPVRHQALLADEEEAALRVEDDALGIDVARGLVELEGIDPVAGGRLVQLHHE